MAMPALQQYSGRRTGVPAGSHIADLVALQQAIVLCWKCRPKFNEKVHGYYRDRRFPSVNGKCDGCREVSPQASFYIHEQFLTGPRGQGGHDKVWMPR